MTRTLAIVITLGATLLAARPGEAQKFVRQDSVRALPAPVLLDPAGMFQDRYAKVGDDFFIAGQPTERALREMKAQGVTTIVNLRTPPEMARIGFDEEKLIAELGMKYVYIFTGGPGEVHRDAACRGREGAAALHGCLACQSPLGCVPDPVGRTGGRCTGSYARNQPDGRAPHGQQRAPTDRVVPRETGAGDR